MFRYKTVARDRIANAIGNALKKVRGGHCGRERFLLTTLLYRSLPYLNFDYCRLVEWQFIGANLPKSGLRVLDIGATSSLFIYELAGRGYDTFACDTRPYMERLSGTIKFIRCDIMATPFPDNFFDIITGISTVEHIGLGFYGDPRSGDGDFKAMNEMKRILKGQGLLCLTTTIGKSYTITPNGNCRIYDGSRLAQLTAPFFTEKEEYYTFVKNKWLETSKRVALGQVLPYYALACLLLRPRTDSLETSLLDMTDNEHIRL